MRKPDLVDEFAETQVLISAEDRLADREVDALSLYAEYESELANETAPRRETRTRR
jgi:hypothetical protein